MAAVIREWKDNPLFPLLKKSSAIGEVGRRAFMPKVFTDLWTAPQNLYVNLDEAGQWADDGGR